MCVFSAVLTHGPMGVVARGPTGIRVPCLSVVYPPKMTALYQFFLVLFARVSRFNHVFTL